MSWQNLVVAWHLNRLCLAAPFLRFLKNLKAQGYRINLCYVWLNSISLTQERVALRVKMSGHTIPPDVSARRYARSMQNFHDLFCQLPTNGACSTTPSSIMKKSRLKQKVGN
nr:hypothetical protein [uncultured Undibacterium sp.]